MNLNSNIENHIIDVFLIFDSRGNIRDVVIANNTGSRNDIEAHQIVRSNLVSPRCNPISIDRGKLLELMIFSQ